MKSLYTLFFVFIGFAAIAQPSSEDFPDFTVTDMNDGEHNLYTYLNEGKIVIIDIFATWCPNCINSLPGIETIWDEHGPEGDNTIVVLSFERDPETTNEASFATQYGVTNPIITNETDLISDTWNIPYQPRFFIICPDKSWQLHAGSIGSNDQILLDYAEDCDTSTGIFDEEVFDLKVINNPVDNGVLQLNIGSEAMVRYEVRDLSGRLSLKGQIQNGNQSINVSDLQEGLYLFSIISERGMVTKRVIVK